MTKQMDNLTAVVLIMMATLHTAFCITPARCVDSCVAQSNGNYQHCSNCHKYVACSNGYKYVMPCPSKLVWDDVKKRCEWTSPTCNSTIIKTTPATTTNPGCVDSCAGQRDGNYQDCSDCHQYVACSNGHKYVMPCPSNLVWDDVKKRCEWTSPTCNATIIKTTPATTTTSNPGCVDSCAGQRDGNYQDCSECHQYVACSNGHKYVMPCPSNLVWDDVKKRCEWTSPTCNATIIKTTPATTTTSNPGCVESCAGQRDGNYQDCSDCHQYVACSNGHKYVMPCPSNLVWDDVKKRCEWTSPTCNATIIKTTPVTTTTSNPGCVDSCAGQRDGNYQDCSECHQYVACSNGHKYVMPCPSNLVWDDVKKRCEWTSPTCNATIIKTTPATTTTSNPGCVDSCAGQRDGNYQDCSECHQYVACSNGHKYVMPCPSNLVWDDVKKRCEWTSPTCNATIIKTTPATTTTSNPGCVDSCAGQRDGNYQDCSDCHQYVACSNGHKYVMPCPSNLVWDDVKKRCEWTSPTCNATIIKTTPATKTTSNPGCVDSCAGQRDGNYQDCSDCHQYVACSNGHKYVMPCPSNLVWDDVKKRCEWTSPTCNATIIKTTPATTTTSNPGCVDSCAGQRDGNYQDCSECHQYVACSNGHKYVMPCPSNLVWDDVKKRCEWTSPTCNATIIKTTPATTTTSNPGCVDSCAGQRDGNYQDCSDCHQYVACSNGHKYVMPCPSNLVWDDVKKRCEWTSPTCNATIIKTTPATTTTSYPGCLNTCVGRIDGNYQHCSECHHYVACSNGLSYVMPCPSNLVWDDVKKRCEWTSSTCITTTPEGCVDSCAGQRDGNYQHCSDCHQYVACSNGYKNSMPCPSNLVWDDLMKRCEWTSSTCGSPRRRRHINRSKQNRQ